MSGFLALTFQIFLRWDIILHGGLAGHKASGMPLPATPARHEDRAEPPGVLCGVGSGVTSASASPSRMTHLTAGSASVKSGCSNYRERWLWGLSTANIYGLHARLC